MKYPLLTKLCANPSANEALRNKLNAATKLLYAPSVGYAWDEAAGDQRIVKKLLPTAQMQHELVWIETANSAADKEEWFPTNKTWLLEAVTETAFKVTMFNFRNGPYWLPVTVIVDPLNNILRKMPDSIANRLHFTGYDPFIEHLDFVESEFKQPNENVFALANYQQSDIVHSLFTQAVYGVTFLEMLNWKNSLKPETSPDNILKINLQDRQIKASILGLY